MTRGVENNKSEWDSKRGDGVDSRHNVVDNESRNFDCTMLHKHTSKCKHWEKEHK